MKLYTYFRSSAAYRVRIALHLKGLAFESVPVHLLRDGGQQHAAGYAALNPNETVPTLDDDGQILNQSLAIIEYLDETHPSPPLLPGSAERGAESRVVLPLGRTRAAGRGENARKRPAHRPLLPRRYAHPGRLLPRSAGVQCPPLWLQPGGAEYRGAHLRRMRRAGRLRTRRACASARRRIDPPARPPQTVSALTISSTSSGSSAPASISGNAAAWS